MNMTFRVIRYLPGIVATLFSVGCAVPNPVLISAEREPGCNVALLSSGKEQLGTVFKLQVGSGVAYLTAAHSLPAIKTRDLNITYKCQMLTIRQKVIALENLPGIDVAIVRPANLIAELPTLQPSSSQAGAITIPNYSLMTSLDPQLGEVSIESVGSLIYRKDGKIYFTASILRSGASGAPVLDPQRGVIGIIIGRFMEGNIYAGIGFGYSVEKILRAISARSTAATATSTGVMWNGE